MKNRVVFIGALLASTGLVALGAPIDGKWTVEVAGRGGGAATTRTLTLKSDGMKITGKYDPGNGMAVDISEGMVHDADVSFKVTTEGRNGPQVTNYKGTLAGDELTLTGTREAAAGGAPGGGGGGGGAPGGGGGGGGRAGGGGGGGRGGAPMPMVFKRAK
jgi:hypothetical protein